MTVNLNFSPSKQQHNVFTPNLLLWPLYFKKSKSKTMEVHCICGLFAIALATILCNAKLFFLKSLEAKHMAPFPSTNKQDFADSIVSIVPIFCNCRMPENPSVHLVKSGIIMNAKQLWSQFGSYIHPSESVARGHNRCVFFWIYFLQFIETFQSSTFIFETHVLKSTTDFTIQGISFKQSLLKSFKVDQPVLKLGQTHLQMVQGFCALVWRLWNKLASQFQNRLTHF